MGTSIYEKKFEVRCSESDINNNLRVDSLFNYMQQIAAIHADILKVGRKNFVSDNLCWVITSAKIEMYSWPKINEEITIKTWPKKPRKILNPRDFYFINSDGIIIGKATTVWVILNVKTREVQNPKIIKIDIDNISSENALNGISKIRYKQDDIAKDSYELKARYSMIDPNLHMNNSKYVSAALDLLNPDEFANKEIKTFEINFIKETKYSQSLNVYRYQSEEGIIIKGIHTDTLQDSFIARINIE